MIIHVFVGQLVEYRNKENYPSSVLKLGWKILQLYFDVFRIQTLASGISHSFPIVSPYLKNSHMFPYVPICSLHVPIASPYIYIYPIDHIYIYISYRSYIYIYPIDHIYIYIL